ncbi:MAG: iron ABC transporter permease, partial [Pseudomonadota bacterium]
MRAQGGLPGSPWLSGVAIALSLVTLVPLLALIVTAFGDTGEAFSHYAQTVLPRYILNTVGLVLFVSVGVVLIGVATAWLITMCRFPGRRIFAWLLVLPFAMPGYVCAYAYAYLLQHPGPVQTALRDAAGWGPRDYWFPDIRSLEGA